ncbi:MAG: hypothetical protein PHD07_02770 [Bacteroidales bacterium]|nr:hypothetical protein [Bacteroidales bacterium]MDD3201636.1 hypothetical protein [Bacteroidales bacterium]
MNKLLRNITCVAVIAGYMMAYMGFGIHECVTEGTKDLILMVGDTSCEAIHSHVHTHMHIHTDTGVMHSHPHTCEGHHHDGDDPDECEHCDHEGIHNAHCCNTNVYIVTDVQDGGNDNVEKVFLPEFTFEHCISVADNIQQSFNHEESAALPPLIFYNLHSYFSVWKL